MARNITGKEFDRNKYVLQHNNGGSGCINIKELSAKFGIITENEINQPGGILGYDANGKIPSSIVGDTSDSTIINGPTAINALQTAQYTIVNYSSSTTYNITFNGGTWTRTGNTITVTAGNSVGTYTLNVNGTVTNISVVSFGPNKPTVVVSGITIVTGARLSISTNAYSSTNGSTHGSTSWQVATDAAFTNIIYQSVDNATNKTNIVTDVGNYATYYVRARFKDQYNVYGLWSEVVSINKSSMSTTIATPSLTAESIKVTNGVKFTITGTAYADSGGGTHSSTVWQIAGDASFTDIVYNNTDITNKTSNVITVASIKTTYYIRAKYIANNNVESSWSATKTFNYSEIPAGIPKNEEAILTASPTNSATYFGHNCVTDATGTRLLVTGNNGVMNIFVRNGSVWTVEFSYAITYGSGSYTNSCAIDDSGTRVFLSHTSGYVYIFVRNNTTWTLELLLTSSDSNTAYFGCQIATNPDGSIIVVTDDSKTDNGSSEKGSCYVYKRTGTSWSKVAKLNLSNTGTAYTSFGSSMAYSEAGSTIILGSKFYSDYRVVWAFTGSGDTWSEGVLLPNPGGSVAKTVRFGDTLIISQDGTRIFISDTAASAGNGSTGVVFCYVKSGNNWVYESTITSPESNSYYFSISALSCNYDGSVLAVGSSYDPISVNVGYGGRVFIYSRTGATWSTTATITASDTSGKLYFGQPISLAKDGSRLFCAATYHGNGDVHVFS